MVDVPRLTLIPVCKSVTFLQAMLRGQQEVRFGVRRQSDPDKSREDSARVSYDTFEKQVSSLQAAVEQLSHRLVSSVDLPTL